MGDFQQQESASGKARAEHCKIERR